MSKGISRRERNVIIVGAVFLAGFLGLWFVLGPQREKLSALKTTVRAMNKEYEDLRRIEAQHNLLKRQTDPVMQRILRRKKDFELSSFVAATEGQLNFSRTREVPARQTPYGDFETQASTFYYRDKKLHQIIQFIETIDRPENVISLDSVRIKPKTSDRSMLELDMKLATVVRAK
jgi:Tfp pilus assembly protein PilO